MTAAEVKCALNARAQRQQMGVNKVAHMDIISNTGAIRRGMVCAENEKGLVKAKGGLQDARNEMSFRIMIFAKSWGGACSVEVAEND